MKDTCLRWALVLLFASLAQAHEHWVDADDFYPDAGSSACVRLCSGHYFPKSSFALKDKVLESVKVWGPDGGAVEVTTAEEEKQRTGILTWAVDGVHVVTFSLRRPQAKKPSYEGKALLAVGDKSDDIRRYAQGTGLELVPGKPVSELMPGDELPVSLRLNGEPISGTLSVSAEGGKTSSLRAGPDRPALIKLRKEGRCLVTASHDGRGCSLIFMVRDDR
ncbi:MAG: DUF4198 domain-containing protein [Verrucomicrobia bacterium]|jgi:uncharacterized GH25 family protein|nr:DUF4198 domain-containing protein [Verrucomicrobiota bacterium]